MDPTGALKDKNAIPQCSWCNQTAKGRFIFDPFGRTKALTVEGLLSHTHEQKEEFYKALKEEKTQKVMFENIIEDFK